MTLYEDSPGYFYDDSHKKWSLFKENNGQWRLEDLANDTRSDHPSFGAAVSALRSRVGDVTVHRKKARMSPIKTAVIKLAQEDPEFRKALVAELRKTALHPSTPRNVSKATKDFALVFEDLLKAGKKLQRLYKKHPVLDPDDDWGRGEEAERALANLLKLLKKWQDSTPMMYYVYADSPMGRQADKWEGPMPKGWTDESRKKFWDSLTSAAPKHKVTECIKRMNKHMGGNAGAFCASLADRVMPGWRQEAAKDRAKKAARPLSELAEFYLDQAAFSGSVPFGAKERAAKELVDAGYVKGDSRQHWAGGNLKITPKGRAAAKKLRQEKKGSSLTQPLRLQRDYGAGSDEDEWLDIEEVKKHCPPCAEKMARNNLRKIRASALRVAMQR